MLTKEQIRKYYQTAPLQLLPHSKFRQYKLFTGKRWIILKNKISTVEQLREELIKHAPHDAFQSVSLWLNPASIEERNQSSITQKLFLSSTGFLDFDSVDGNVARAKQDMKATYGFLKSRKYQELKIVFSGKKGYHLYFDLRKYDNEFSEPNQRMRYYQALKKTLLRNLEHLNLTTLDVNTSADIWRVSRIIGSLHHSGGICREANYLMNA